jgi:hypothetical protein
MRRVTIRIIVSISIIWIGINPALAVTNLTGRRLPRWLYLHNGREKSLARRIGNDQSYLR